MDSRSLFLGLDGDVSEGKENPSSPVNMDTVRSVYGFFQQSLLVIGGFVFGSVARQGLGNDLDIILIAPEGCVREFNNIIKILVDGLAERKARGRSSRPDAYFHKSYRLEVACDLLGLDSSELGDHAFFTDVFIFPSNWRERLEELQQALPHQDPKFMENIARDAKEL